MRSPHQAEPAPIRTVVFIKRVYCGCSCPVVSRRETKAYIALTAAVFPEWNGAVPFHITKHPLDNRLRAKQDVAKIRQGTKLEGGGHAHAKRCACDIRFPVQAFELPRPVRCRDSSTHLCADVAGWSCVLGSHTLCAHVGSAIVHIRRTAEAILYALIDSKFSRRRK